MVKIVIPVMDDGGEVLSSHFGRAPYFAWFEVEEGQVTGRGVIPNDSEHFGGTGNPPERISRLGADVVISPGMGIRAINMFQQMGVAVLQAKGHGVEENIEFFMQNELQELTRGCLHSRRH